MNRAAIYARFSSHLQREASIEDQVRLCAERAEREGWEVTDTFSDMAISGASMRRPGLQSMISAVERGQFDVLVVEALDRLSRDQADVATLYKTLTFHGVKIVTLAEGEISELHVGLMGTMNQLFLKDLADKTRRGLRGRAEKGCSGGGNAYGYNVVRRLGADGNPVTGEREINEEEAGIIRRVFREFAAGRTPRDIARRLNDDGVPGPRGKLWRDTAIRGHRARGTGLLNNELYLGRLVWNRMRCVKDPSSGKRVSRLNPRDQWIIKDVPDLRIIDDALWQKVKQRQEEIDGTDRVQGIRASRFWEQRRAAHLVSGLLVCGSCGGSCAVVGRDYLACSAARKLGTCQQRWSVRRGELEAAVLGLLQTRLMEPDAVAEFMNVFAHEVNRQRSDAAAEHQRREQERQKLKQKLHGLYHAIADGLRSPGLQEQLLDLEGRLADLDRRLAADAPTTIRLHPRVSEIYRDKVEKLSMSLSDPEIRTEALDVIRGLIDSVIVSEAEDGAITEEPNGAIASMIEAAQPGALSSIDACSVKVVAGVGFEPTTFRL